MKREHGDVSSHSCARGDKNRGYVNREQHGLQSLLKLEPQEQRRGGPRALVYVRSVLQSMGEFILNIGGVIFGFLFQPSERLQNVCGNTMKDGVITVTRTSRTLSAVALETLLTLPP